MIDHKHVVYREQRNWDKFRTHALLGVAHLTNHIAVLLQGRPPSKEQVNKFSNCI